MRVVVIAALLLTATTISVGQQNPPQAKHQKNKAKNQAVQPPPAPVPEVRDSTPASAPAPQAKEQTPKPELKPFLSHGEWVMGVLTAIYVLISLFSFKAIQRQADIAADSAVAANNAATAAQDAARAAERNTEALMKLGVRSEIEPPGKHASATCRQILARAMSSCSPFSRCCWMDSRCARSSTPKLRSVQARRSSMCSPSLKKTSLIYAAGVYQSRGRMGGMLFENGDAFFVGKYSGASQSLQSKMVGPPRKAPYVAPVILWLMGFFIVMAFAGRGKLSLMMGALSVGYLLILPAYLLAAPLYNFLVCPKKHKAWENQFLCQRCGTVVAPMACPNDTVPSRV